MRWLTNDKLKIEITDVMKLLKLKAGGSMLPLVGGFVAYKHLRRR